MLKSFIGVRVSRILDRISGYEQDQVSKALQIYSAGLTADGRIERH